MQRKIIATDKAPKAIGPYSQAIVAGDLVFASGQIPLEASTMAIVAGDIKVQTRKVLENLRAVLEAAGSSLEKTVKTSVFLKSMNDFPAMNEVYAEFFGVALPARVTVEVARLPKDVLIEIDAIAVC